MINYLAAVPSARRSVWVPVFSYAETGMTRVGTDWAIRLLPYVLSRQPVRKIQATAARQTMRKPSVAAKLTQTPTSDLP